MYRASDVFAEVQRYFYGNYVLGSKIAVVFPRNGECITDLDVSYVIRLTYSTYLNVTPIVRSWPPTQAASILRESAGYSGTPSTTKLRNFASLSRGAVGGP